MFIFQSTGNLNRELLIIFLVVFVAVPIFVAIFTTLVLYIKSPFKYPYLEITFNVTGVKQPKTDDYIDKYLIENKMKPIDNHVANISKWRERCSNDIKKSLFKKRRQKQFEQCCENKNPFHFVFIRNKTRYKQINYVRHPYTVKEVYCQCFYPYSALQDRYRLLESIDFETTISNYKSKKQRSLMTKELREQISRRDNYTCQICGKYMPDGVGLHIDHIIPVSKGGKSVPSNLQVLCSKCNGKKSSN